MIKLKKAYPNDKDRIMPVILDGFDFNEFSRSTQIKLKQFWIELFDLDWKSEEDHIGYYLENEKGQVVGFDGYLFSERKIHGNVYKFCNLSTWVVKKDYRHYGLMLLKPLLDLKKTHIITNQTPNPAGYSVLTTRFKFSVLEENKLFIPAILNLKLMFNKLPRISNDIDTLRLSDDEHEIYMDHSKTKLKFVQIEVNSQLILLAYRRKTIKRMPFVEIHYISNRPLFIQNLSSIRLIITLRTKSVAIIIDSRLINYSKPSFTYQHKMTHPKLFSGNASLKGDIDNLYSELTIL
jgi:acetoacetyl-CoA synthetase